MTDSPIYVSIDVESNGPVPGLYSMLSLGAAAFSYPGETPLRVFSANLECLPGASFLHPQTKEFWQRHPKEFAATRENLLSPSAVMNNFHRWLNELSPRNSQLVAVAYPLGFDWMFLTWYLINFVGRNPLGLNGVDLKTMAWMIRGGDFRATSKKKLPREWFAPASPHTHVAVEDAIEQGVMFIRMLKGGHDAEGSSPALDDKSEKIGRVDESTEVPVL